MEYVKEKGISYKSGFLFSMKRASEKRLVGIKNSWKYEKDF